ncbi:ATP-binding cassette domain-containing protein [Schaedlerella sp.]|uniref:ATP-binding cassette domain-containing protein n=1 Tax=Schaedlerella sp. TaxID=2676057 RepID=UPI003744BE92
MKNEQLNEKIPDFCFRLQDITKKFESTVALTHMSLEVRPGEIIGLIGPNGAGKSTLMGVFTGVVPATEGRIEAGGQVYSGEKYSTAIARLCGIACCYQEFSVCANLAVYENFAITVMDHKPFGERGWRKKMIRQSQAILDEVFPDNQINVRGKVASLSIEQKQMVEICCAMATNGLKVLILDEPTSSLTNDRIEQFHRAIRGLKEKQISVIYISHKLEEIIRISTRILVMKNGEKTWEGETKNVTAEELVNLMGGSIAIRREAEKNRTEEEHLVDVKDLSNDVLHHVNMHVCKGEVVGISGLGGSGQRELLNEIYRAAKGGRSQYVSISGDASFVSGDRQKEGIFKLWSIADNTIISSLKLLTGRKLLDEKQCDDLAQRWYDKLKFKAAGKEDLITNLSGGNQQKAIIGRGIASEADLIIFDDPTRGVDAGTKKEIYSIIEEISGLGKSVIWYSTEDNEMLECSRVYVMRNGTIAAELEGDEISVDAVVATSFQDVEQGGERGDTKEKESMGKRILSVLTSGSGISVLVLIAIWLIMGMFNSNVNTRMGMTYMIGTALPLVFVSIGQMFIVESGDINLGIGNAMGLVSVISATILAENIGMGLLAILGVWILYSAVAVLIHKRNMPSIVVSLGMMSIWLGIALLLLPTPGGRAPEWLSVIFTIRTPVLPVQVYMCVIAAAAGYWLVFRFKYGMVLRGIGDNPGAVSKRGWSYFTAHVVTYAISGFFVILAGMAMTYVSKGADANAAFSYQMMSIATILLGGCAFSGGIVEPVGVVAGALSISLISSMLTFMQINSNYRTGVIGVILLIVLICGATLKRRKVN